MGTLRSSLNRENLNKFLSTQYGCVKGNLLFSGWGSNARKIFQWGPSILPTADSRAQNWKSLILPEHLSAPEKAANIHTV